MKHILPTIEELTNTNFSVINNPHEDIDKKILVSDTFLFWYRSETLLSLASDIFRTLSTLKVPIDKMPWAVSETIQLNEDWYSIIPSIKCERLLVENNGSPVGYINTSELASTALSSYHYLKTYHDTILETTDSSISVIDENKITVAWTSGAEKIFSIKRDEIIGQPMNHFFEDSMLEIIKTVETGESVRRKQHQPREDLFVLINTNPVKIGDKIIGAVVAETDVTDQVLLNKELNNANKTIKNLREEVSRIRPSYNPFHSIKGSSTAISKTLEKVKQIGTTQARVLFLGESGVGKELFAKAMHDIRTGDAAPFIPVNCGAIPESLFESELFGYEKGAFSGANSHGKKGKFELAKGGTLFLDEIGELPLEMQVKLLRVLQEGTYYAVGGTKQKRADCQIITATNKDLQKLVSQGKFREDLYYRLNIISITIPPLRERVEDIIELSHLFLYEFSTKYNREVQQIPKEIMSALLNHRWPGNVRELRNAIERLVVFSSGGHLDVYDLPFEPNSNLTSHEDILLNKAIPMDDNQIVPLKDALAKHEKILIEAALQEVNENKNKAAQLLKISRATLYNKMNKLGIVD
ncbi:sigma 54-interacting transcriptional regulator [Radiobacillus kanasensis]|uniref:sigma-54 interaction domain-containing protein n=1 Tax=Radiobacillus kanasensis TaxID=2844358 RepID=UPI001E40E0D8|nr:sigma 54-interacting transcriptional regulator [Radiobacillus kanasensis]UFT98823.1 sigma 54-interacting transcriptional regulator [Radiobacillus kanasensis]